MQIQTEWGAAIVLADCPLLDSTERFEFLTEVHESHNGTEIRQSLRDQARQILEFNYVNFRKNMGDMFHLIYANLRGLWAIPLYQLRQNIGDIDSNQIEVDYVDELHHYALINNQVVQIESIQNNVLTFFEHITAENASIVPLRLCIIDGDVSINASGFYAQQSIIFRVIAEDCPEISGQSAEQHKGYDLYFDPLLLDGDALSMSLSQHQVVVDGDLGGFEQFTHWAKPRYLKPFRSLLKNHSDFIKYRCFLFKRMGKLNPFWLPLYERHLDIVNLGVNWIEVSNNYVIEADRKHIALKINDIWQTYEVLSKSKSGANTRLNLSKSVGVLITDIQSICYLGLYRLASDQVEFGFLGAGLVEVNVPIVELQA